MQGLWRLAVLGLPKLKGPPSHMSYSLKTPQRAYIREYYRGYSGAMLGVKAMADI